MENSKNPLWGAVICTCTSSGWPACTFCTGYGLPVVSLTGTLLLPGKNAVLDPHCPPFAFSPFTFTVLGPPIASPTSGSRTIEWPKLTSVPCILEHMFLVLPFNAFRPDGMVSLPCAFASVTIIAKNIHRIYQACIPVPIQLLINTRYHVGRR